MPTISGNVSESGVPVPGRVIRAYRRDTGALIGSAVSSDGTSISGDPDFEKVTLLMHFEGTDGSTAFGDSSGQVRATSVTGSPTISSLQSRFGASSGRFVGSGAVHMPDVPALRMGSDDFTVECWVRHTSVSGFQGYLSKRGSNAQFGEFALYASGAQVNFLTSTTGSSWTGVTQSGSLLVADTWVHVAGVRHGSLMRLFVGGVQAATAAISGSVVADTHGLAVGANATNGEQPLFGFLDEVRITKGLARYTANFTPPALKFSDGVADTPGTVGAYAITTAFAGEVQVVCLDDAAGVDYQDLILRTTPV